jgi:hypothetical protein
MRVRVPPSAPIVCALLLLLSSTVAGSAQSAPRCGPGESPTYVFGFASLHDQLDAGMGQPVSCEYADPNGSGDTLQDTTGGLAYWRKATNTPTFTDGATHWALTEIGLVSWTGPSIDPPPQNWSPPAPTKAVNCSSSGGLPDPDCTPGAIDPAVTQDHIQETICVAGYTTRVRPPTSYTTPLKRTLMIAYGYVAQPALDYELDHLISLELGGAPRAVANLWPEAWSGTSNARQKDVVENALHRQVCNGAVTLADAQRQIATNWLAAIGARNGTIGALGFTLAAVSVDD